MKVVIPTGGVGKHPPSEAAVASEVLRNAGVPEGDIVAEKRGRNTQESAKLVAGLASEMGIENVLIVTDPLHCVRAVSIFREAGLSATAAPTYDSPMWSSSSLRQRQLMRETGAVIWHRIRSRLQPSLLPTPEGPGTVAAWAPGTDNVNYLLPVDAPLRGDPKEPDRVTYDNVINQFAVEVNPRYCPRDNDTYCNIFVWDVTRAMGAEVPHWVGPNNEPVEPMFAEQGRVIPDQAHWMSANHTHLWLNRYGPQYGWREVSAEEAQASANLGHPTVASVFEVLDVGHTAIVRPGEMLNGPALAQAGIRNLNYAHVYDIFPREGTQFFVNDDPRRVVGEPDTPPKASTQTRDHSPIEGSQDDGPRKDSSVSLEQLQGIMPDLEYATACKYLPYINAAMSEADINTPLRQASFLAQLAHESGEFRRMEELIDSSDYESRVMHGNIYEEDGLRYKARGPIQLSERHNYAAASEVLGIDLVENPERVADPDVGFRTAAWYWSSRELNYYADLGNFDATICLTNGGWDGYESRWAYYLRACKVLGA